MSDTKEDEEMMEAHLLNDYGEAPIETESKQEELPQLENAGESVVSVNQNLDLSTEFDANNTINALDDGRNAPVANGNDEEDQGSFEPVVDGNNTGNKSNGNDTVDAIVIEESKTNGVDAKEFENGVFDTKTEDESVKEIIKREASGSDMAGGMVLPTEEKNAKELEVGVKQERVGVETPKTPHPLAQEVENDELSGTEEEQAEFTKELEKFYKEKNSEFKPPKFYGKEINCLKLWRAVTKLGGYDQVTGCKLWKHVGGTFNPPKTCTTVSWTFRGFYEKALLDYERHNRRGSELSVPFASLTDSVSVENQISGNQASGSGRVRRESATRAMQGWHSQRLLGNGEVGDPVIKEKSLISMPMHEKQIETDGVHKVKKSSNLERTAKAMHTTAKASKLQTDVDVVDVGPPADWVKINVRRTKDCFEVYALVPGLLREEVRVQSDPAGRLVISGEPEKPDNPWGVTPFKKVVSLPCRIDPLHTSAVVTLHGQLFVRAPFEQSKS